MTYTPEWIEIRRKFIACIERGDHIMLLVRKLTSGKIYIAEYTWWFDVKEKLYCCESWPAADFVPASQQHLERFKSEEDLQHYLFATFGGYKRDFKVWPR